MENTQILIILLLLIGIAILINGFSYMMSKLLRVERKKWFWFSYNHINDVHKKVDWVFRIAFAIIIIVSAGYNIYQEPSEPVWYLETWFLLIISIVLSESVRAYMEWKYEENRNAYLLTIFETAFILLLYISVLKTDFFYLI